MFGLGKPRAKALYGAMFDIGSESVGIAIVASLPTEPVPRTLFSHRVPLRIGKHTPTYDEQFRNMREALFSACLIASREGIGALSAFDPNGRVSKILATVSAPWAHTISRNVVYAGDEEVKVTRDLIDELVQGAESEIKKHIDELTKDTPDTPDIVERSTIDVRINDYTVRNPIGLHGKDISLVHITGLIPHTVIDALHDVEEKIFPHTVIRAHTFMLVLYCVLRDTEDDTRELTIMNITGESTEIGIVEHDTLVETLSIPYGYNHILRGLMVSEHDADHDALARLNLYRERRLAPTEHARVRAQFDTYGTSLTDTLTELVPGKRFPKRIILSAPHPYNDLFVSELAPTLMRYMKTEEPIRTPTWIDPATEQPDAPSDPNLMAAARFFHKLHGCGEIEV